MSVLLASGRTADVYREGAGRVRRVYRDGRDAEAEAELMRYLASWDFPVPQVFDADGPTIVMALVDGPTLTADLSGCPDRVDAAALAYRALFDRLADLPAPAGLSTPFGAGDSILHLDLHPDNVVLSADGPVVIDWSTAARGPAPADRALAWVVVTTAEKPDPALADAIFARLRHRFATALMDDHDPAAGFITVAARHRLRDPFVPAAERPAIQRLVDGR